MAHKPTREHPRYGYKKNKKHITNMARNNKQFSKIKEIIKFIFDYKCAICGHTSLKNHLHHLDKNPQNNHVSNFAVLCKEHHTLTHRLHLQIEPNRTETQTKLLTDLQKFL